MILLTVIVILSLLFGVVVYAVLAQSGVLPGNGDGVRVPRVPHLGELPQGCLLALILAAAAWFALWAVVLVLALRFLRSPLGG